MKLRYFESIALYVMFLRLFLWYLDGRQIQYKHSMWLKVLSTDLSAENIPYILQTLPQNIFLILAGTTDEEQYRWQKSVWHLSDNNLFCNHYVAKFGSDP